MSDKSPEPTAKDRPSAAARPSLFSPETLAQVAITLAAAEGTTKRLPRDDRELRAYFWRAKGILIAAMRFVDDETSGKNEQTMRKARSYGSDEKRVSLDTAGYAGKEKWISNLKGSHAIRKAIKRLLEKDNKRPPNKLLLPASIVSEQWKMILKTGRISEAEAKALDLSLKTERAERFARRAGRTAVK